MVNFGFSLLNLVKIPYLEGLESYQLSYYEAKKL